MVSVMVEFVRRLANCLPVLVNITPVQLEDDSSDSCLPAQPAGMGQGMLGYRGLSIRGAFPPARLTLSSCGMDYCSETPLSFLVIWFCFHLLYCLPLKLTK